MTEAPRRGVALPIALLALTGVALAVSAVRPHDYPTWLLETAPVLIAAPLLVLTFRRFPLTTLAYVLIFLHALVLILGAHHTYARVPLGFWLQDVFGFDRNPYDRVGHLMQGFAPAIVVREILLRTSPLVRGAWLFVLTLATCLAISALYELLEWLAAVLAGGGAEDFLGTQGDEWDAQWDMFLALCGAAASLLTLGRLHDRGLERLPGR